MNKYIIKVNYSNKQVSIITLKATSDSDLELKIAKELQYIFGNLSEIESIEYEEVEQFTFSEKGLHLFTGKTYVGGELLEKLLEDKRN